MIEVSAYEPPSRPLVQIINASKNPDLIVHVSDLPHRALCLCVQRLERPPRRG